MKIIPGIETAERRRRAQRSNGFTLLEVIIAMSIFFMVAFAVLELVTRGLGQAEALTHRRPDVGELPARLSLTNMLEEGVESGEFDLYPGYSWTRDITEVSKTNGLALFQVDFVIFRHTKGKTDPEGTLSVLMCKPAKAGISPGQKF